MTRGLDVGVLAVVLDADGRVLVLDPDVARSRGVAADRRDGAAHGPGATAAPSPMMRLPGGLLEPGLTAEAVLVRQLLVQAGLSPVERPILCALLHGADVPGAGPDPSRAHGLIYRVDHWTRVPGIGRSEERWLAVSDLPSAPLMLAASEAVGAGAREPSPQSASGLRASP
jgi:8-oxo-dGTP pyrophosphatase MutT (NUDIX family)